MASATTQTANAIAAITNRANVTIPEIDFTQHQLENGEVVSTTERVVKDVSTHSASSPILADSNPIPWLLVFWGELVRVQASSRLLPAYTFTRRSCFSEPEIWVLSGMMPS